MLGQVKLFFGTLPALFQRQGGDSAWDFFRRHNTIIRAGNTVGAVIFCCPQTPVQQRWRRLYWLVPATGYARRPDCDVSGWAQRCGREKPPDVSSPPSI